MSLRRDPCVPAFNNVVGTPPSTFEVKVQFRESSAGECGFSIGGLEQWQTDAAIVVGSQVLRFDANMIILTGRGKRQPSRRW